MAPEATGQGRDDVAVAQLCRVHVDVAEQPKAEPGEARAPEQHMLRCVCLLLADNATRRGAVLLRTAGARARREAADAV